MLAILIIFIGLIAGVVVNVLADDLPHYHRPRLPHYPDGAARPVAAWLGITAFLLGKREYAEGKKLSWRYPLVEIACVALMLITLSVQNGNPGEISDLQLMFWLAYMAIFVLITVTDIEHHLILFSVIIPAGVLGILDAILTPGQFEPDLGRALTGGALGFGIFFVMYMGGFLYVYVVQKARGREITEVAFGFGDVMLATFSGLILGVEPLLFAIFITVVLGAFGSILFLVISGLRGKKEGMFVALPYGPYIIIGTLLMLLFRSEVRFLLFGY
ncbi:MAG: prepilin peptidase [Anaerolineaceae bacterium]|nr:prepilin peptidase [Anaerolineaceae bacterium]